MLRGKALLGVDVGFSKSRASTGIAWYASGRFEAAAVKSDKKARLSCLPSRFCADAAALDGPLVPQGSEGSSDSPRYAERLLSRGTFQHRCKPGFSHFGTGLELRKASHIAASQVRNVVKENSRLSAPFCLGTRSIVEAFPNAFLGVLLDDDVYAKSPKLKRGQKFDWLYESAIENRALERVMSHVGFCPPGLLAAVQREQHHEKRAAYVCLITAACVAAKELTSIGDKDGGWIVLPPLALWADWSKNALDESERALTAETSARNRIAR